jgi:hypothetical protein
MVDIDEFKWEGSKYNRQIIHSMVLEKIKPVPWPIKVLGIEDFGRATIFVRKDVGLHMWWIVAYTWYKCFYNIRLNENGIINQFCFKLLSYWWRANLKYRFKGDAKAYSQHSNKGYWRKNDYRR